MTSKINDDQDNTTDDSYTPASDLERPLGYNLKPHLIPPRVRPIDGKCPKLKVCCVAIGEVGHMIPLSKIAESLVQRGHEVHYITNEDEWTVEKAKIFLDPTGASVHYTGPSDVVDRKCLFAKGAYKINEVPHMTLQDAWKPYVNKKIEEIMPDIVIHDFWCKPGAIAADRLGIPSIVNIPGPNKIFESINLCEVPDMRRSRNCCGFICLKRNILQGLMTAWFGIQNMDRREYEYNRSFSNRVVLVNSFFGLEQPRCLPPNVQMMGAMIKSQKELLVQFKERNRDLYDWVEEAQKNGQDVVYITIGSYCILRKWCIDAIYYGLKRIGCRVIWSLKAEYHDMVPEENPNFWIRSWNPQVELLSHPAVKAGISHCGWGGTMEFIATGTPLVGFPHFFDQFESADLICNQNQAGIILHSKFRLTIDPKEATVYNKPAFDQDKVYKVFKEILVDNHDYYKQNMVRLQKLSEAVKGREQAVRIVEQVAMFGAKHLVDEGVYETRERQHCAGFFIICLFVVALLVGNLFYFNALYPQAASNLV